MENFKMSNAEAFVVPNTAGTMRDLWLGSSKEAMMKLAELNGFEITDDDSLIEVWVKSDETDNMTDHGVDIDGLHVTVPCNYLPYKILEGKVEGEVIHVVFPATYRRPGHVKEIHTTVEADITLNQRGYRYRQFGNFEDAVKRVLCIA